MNDQSLKKTFANEHVKKIARAFAYDLLRYSEHGGDMENVTAKKVYALLEELDRQAGQRILSN